MRTVGVVVNPIAGMGGRVGLKGTDGKVREARQLGAEPRAPDRAVEALAALHDRAPGTRVLAAGGAMGADEARAAGFDPEVVYEPGGGDAANAGASAADSTAADSAPTDSAAADATTTDTTAEDTKAAVREFVDRGVDLVLFVGGDGTAADVATTLEELGADVPMLGVPAGVKVYSSVFAVTPPTAGRVAADFDRVEDREVADLDEDAYRAGEVVTELRAVVAVPVADGLQSGKQLPGGTVESLAEGFASEVDPGVTYVFGPGGTVGAIEAALGFEGSPLGVDVWRDGEVLARDAGESEILDALGEENVVVVSPIGGQGFVFGRGNQQLSPAVLRRSDVEIVASRRKLDETGVLRVDTGDSEVDESLRGWWKVRVGRYERRMMKVA